MRVFMLIYIPDKIKIIIKTVPVHPQNPIHVITGVWRLCESNSRAHRYSALLEKSGVGAIILKLLIG